MFNTEGFDKLYTHIMKDFPALPDDSLLRDIFWIAFSDLTPGMRPSRQDLEKRLLNYMNGETDYLGGVKVMSAVSSLPIYKLMDDGENVLGEVEIDGRKIKLMPLFTSPGDCPSYEGVTVVATTIFHVADFLEEHKNVEGIIISPETVNFVVKTKDIESFFMNFSTMYGFFEDCLREGIPEDYLFPMIFAWFEDRDVEMFFKDGAFCEGHVTDLIYGDLGDVTSIRVKTADGSTIAGIDEIASIRALPLNNEEERKAMEEALSNLNRAMTKDRPGEEEDEDSGQDTDTDSDLDLDPDTDTDPDTDPDDPAGGLLN
ncbi:MAG: hypothetical protein LUE27_08260 [Clostridia bacterium]|nr:hypothetical protein [Clostridia bacterium]